MTPAQAAQADFDRVRAGIEAFEFRGLRIPGHMHEGLARYIVYGILPGDFLTSVLEGNLFEAMGRADDKNIHALPAYGGYLYNEAPRSCYGSPEKVRAYSEEVRRAD